MSARLFLRDLPRAALPYVLTVLLAPLVLAGCGKQEPAPTTAPAPPSAPGAVAGPGAAPADVEAPAAPELAEAVAAVTEEARAQVEAYLENLDVLNGVLEGIGNRFDAATATPRIAGLIDEIKAHWTGLNEMDPEATAQLRQAFSSQLQQLEGAFKAQVERIGTELGLSDVASLLEGVPLFGSE